ncbi:MAG: hypothetical protein EXS05_01235 [Planctomycetaceae bacterium]|nr:hypothetical protein [Planctomycetaceae bacterium]
MTRALYRNQRYLSPRTVSDRPSSIAASISPTTDGRMRHDRRRRVCLAGLGILALTFAAGCPKPDSSTTSAGTGAAGGSSQPDDQCEDLLATVHDTFQLHRLEITTTVADGVNRLNDWQRGCAPQSTAGGALPPAIRKVMTAAQRDALTETLFTPRDGEHLRDGMMLRSLGQFAFQTADLNPTELQRVVAAFEFVIRNVELIAKAPYGLPLTLYDIGLVGKGTPADRAWLFAGLLRNEKIDSVLLVAAAAQDGSANPEEVALVGVLLDGQTYLFDPLLGVPVPGPQPSESAVATFEQAVTDPSVLRQLDVGNDFHYPLESAGLRRARVLAISDSAFWSDRMRRLQGEFTGRQTMVIADPLHDTADGPGLWSRVARSGGEFWSADRMGLWNYPETQLAAHAELDATRRDDLRALLAPFNAYMTIGQGQDGQLALTDRQQFLDPAGDMKLHGAIRIVRQTTVGAQRKARLKHLAGEFAEAVHEYQLVRQHSQEVVNLRQPPGISVPHQRAIDDAIFWTALCKFEQGEYRVAVDNLQRYRKQQNRDQEASWNRQCRYLLALSHAARKNYPEAIDELSAVEVDDPEFAGYQSLIRSWRAAAAADQK